MQFSLHFVSFLSQYKAIKITDFQLVIEGFDAPFPIRKKRCIFLCVLNERKILLQNLRQKYAFFGLQKLKAKSEIDAIFCMMFQLEKYRIFAV